MALTPEEDADLRRLAVFDRTGFLTDEGRARLIELRSRDRRATIRPPKNVEPLANQPHLGVLPPIETCSVYPDAPRLVVNIPAQRTWHRHRALGH